MMFFPSDTTGIAIIAPAVYADLPELGNHVFQALNIRPTLYNGRVHTPLDYCRTDMENDADFFHGIWRKTGDDVLVRTGYEKKGFFDEIDRLKANGYSVVDIETYTNKGKRYWDAVLKKGIPETRLVSDLTLSELKPKIQEMKDAGYIVTDIESYIAGNSGRLWGAVFYKSNQQNSALFKLSASELLSKHQAMKANGLKLMDIEAYPVDNDFHWMGIWATGGDSELEMNLKISDLYTLLPQKRNRGYRLVDLEYYLVNNNSEWRANAVWQKGSGDEFITGEMEDSDGDGQDDDKDTSSFQNFCDHMKTHHNKMNGYELIDWERIDIEVFED